MSLSKKMLRDIRINKTQFIAIFLMAFIGIFAYSGIYSEYYGLVQTSDEFYADTNMADGWIYNTDFDYSSVHEIDAFTTQTDRQEVVQSVADLGGKPDITLHFTEKGTISKFYTTEGEDFDPSDDSGVWLDERFADERDLYVGDKITFDFNNHTIKKEIKGLGYSPEYVYEVSPSSLTPDFSQLGFAYLSYKSYPDDLKYNTMLVKYDSSDKEFKEKLDDSVDYLSFTKKEDHLSVSKFANEMTQHKMIGDVFPIVFILVTFLTLLTTMTRIVTNQRTQIGILKAVGFKNSTIILHYLAYAFFPVLFGSVSGLITGPMIIPQMFYPTMSTMYSMPAWHPGFDMSFVYIAILLVVLSVLVTYWACRRISKENPANTMRPKAPDMSSKSFIERSKLWNRLSFNFRWNLRDARSNKFRAFMAIVGVMGCVALLIAAFGMNDSLNELKSWEYDDISHFESKLQISNTANPMELYYVLNETNGTFIMQQSIEMKANGEEDTVGLLVSNNTDLISYTDRDRNPIDIDEGDVSLSAKLAEKFNVTKGDKIRWHIVGSDEWVTSKIGQIHAEPVSQGLIMSPDTLEDQGLDFTPTNIITNEKFGENFDSIKSVTSMDKLKDSWDQMTTAVMMMVYVVTFVAVALAILVLYNLGILSFTEMEREIATLKVLGFKTNVLRKLLLTQNIIFTSIGFILGIPIGFYFMTLMLNAAGESLYYVPTLTWGNILLCAAITFTISIGVNLLFSDKIRNLDMVEALKDIE
ncbi:ABC transporter permease [Methanobrevibacter thaueri]|uniref:Outer membrane-specific lipoprotein transporter subunit LolC n=1 Tax=Methanobrevibacter thaueri TaxID=190975 RepID=A0A315XPZ6_9EURY|nr:ABC transporter permease [Methanobrevibacter thaueri]PWB86852.1 outer membrane-specific lipoprotein transporter subunit LolC [Methanobrevibacter thaueri]